MLESPGDLDAETVRHSLAEHATRSGSRSQATIVPWFFISSREITGLSTGRGTGIQNLFSRLRIEQAGTAMAVLGSWM